MARTVMSITQAKRSGTALVAAVAGDVTNGHVVTNDGRTGILVKNSGTTVARVVTFRFFKTVDGQSVTSRAESLAVGATELFGPFPIEDYGNNLEIDADNAELQLQAVRV